VYAKGVLVTWRVSTLLPVSFSLLRRFCLIFAVDKIERERARLELEAEAAAVAAQHAAESAQTLLAKSFRLQRQQRMLRDRRDEMLRRGLESLEELEVEDRKEGEQKERERIEKEALQLAAASSSSASDPLDLSWWTGALSPSFGVDPGSGDGTVLPSRDTS
jgi:hypothetical protein